MQKLRRSAGFSITLALLAAILMIVPSSLQAQSFYGSIVGTVTDPSKAVVPGATVTITDVGTNERQTMKSDGAGNFRFVDLVPATYTVDVEMTGFKRFVREQLPVEVGAVARVDAALQVGAVTEVVEVSTDAPLLQADSSTLTQQITGDQVQQMPLNGRNVENLIALAPGVVPGAGAMGPTGLNSNPGTRTAGGSGWGNYEIGGAVGGQSSQYIDGVPNNILGKNIVALVPTQDAIQEFSVSSSNATADFGRFAGGVVSLTTKSGTNSIHGTLYEYLRNADFNANDFFSNRIGSPRIKFNQNQYGAVIDGPIKRDKAFFLFTWEGYAALTGVLNPVNVPTTAASRATWGGSDMQDGIFSDALFGITATQTTSYTDLISKCVIDGPATTGNPAPGFWTITNLASCGDPLNAVIRTYYPSPNLNPNTAATNWFVSTPVANHQNQYNARVDYDLGAKQRVFGRYTYWNLQDVGQSNFGDKGLNGVPWPTANGHNAIYAHQAVLGDTYTINPTTVLDVRVNYVRVTSPNLPEDSNVNEAQFGALYAALAPQMFLHVLPGYSANGIHSLIPSSNFQNSIVNWWNTYGINANLTKILGSHNLKFGTELRLMDDSGTGTVSNAAGGSNYTTAFTGDEWASFLLGYPTQVTFNKPASVAAYTYYQAYYVSDNWQATRNLTLNLGLRYELPGAIAERNNRAIVLLPNAVDPYTGITGTLSLVDSPLYARRTTVVPEYNLFAPRVGLAYRASGSTVIRGGYGLSYLPNDLTNPIPIGALINTASTQVNVATTGSPIPLQTILQNIVNNGGIQPPTGRSQPNFMTLYGSKTTYLAKNVSGPDPFQPYPYAQQWNMALSHEFRGDWMAEIAYAGLKGTNMPGATRGLDELPDQYDSMGTALSATAACANANGLSLSVGQCLRPYPYYNNFTDAAASYGRQNYRSLQVRAEKRFGVGGVLSGNYTASKNMGNTGTVQDWNNLAAEYSLLATDVTNRMIVNYVLNLPFGKGKKYANNLRGSMNALASGWTVTGIGTVQSGNPIGFTTSTQSKLQSSFGAGTTRPNVVPGCNKKIAGSGLSRVNAGAWFNISCFQYAGDYTFGNEPTNDPDLRGDGIKNLDFSFQKSTSFFESKNLEFRAEFFNALNRVQFLAPFAVQGASNFGQVSSQANMPRQIQLSLRINF